MQRNVCELGHNDARPQCQWIKIHKVIVSRERIRTSVTHGEGIRDPCTPDNVDLSVLIHSCVALQACECSIMYVIWRMKDAMQVQVRHVEGKAKLQEAKPMQMTRNDGALPYAPALHATCMHQPQTPMSCVESIRHVNVKDRHALGALVHTVGFHHTNSMDLKANSSIEII